VWPQCCAIELAVSPRCTHIGRRVVSERSRQLRPSDAQCAYLGLQLGIGALAEEEVDHVCVSCSRSQHERLARPVVVSHCVEPQLTHTTRDHRRGTRRVRVLALPFCLGRSVQRSFIYHQRE
jgi:hypothetical protein